MFGMTAEPYQARRADTPYAPLAPDVWIRKPDQILCQQLAQTVLQVNANYKPLAPDISDRRYPNSAVKSSHALLASNLPAKKKPASLSAAHSKIVQAMEESAQ